MPSVSFYYTIKLWTRTEACDMDFLGKHHCVYKPSNRVNPVIGLCFGTATEAENSSMEMTPIGQGAQLPEIQDCLPQFAFGCFILSSFRCCI